MHSLVISTLFVLSSRPRLCQTSLTILPVAAVTLAPFPQVPMMFDMTEAVDYRRIDETDMSPAGPLPPLEGFEIDYIPDIVAIICQIKYVHDASDMPR